MGDIKSLHPQDHQVVEGLRRLADRIEQKDFGFVPARAVICLTAEESNTAEGRVLWSTAYRVGCRSFIEVDGILANALRIGKYNFVD